MQFLLSIVLVVSMPTPASILSLLPNHCEGGRCFAVEAVVVSDCRARCRSCRRSRLV